MPKIILHYLDAKAMGESSRLLLAYGGEEFEDHRLKMDDLPEPKPERPFVDTLPVIDIDDQMYGESMQIGEILGRRFGIAGKTPEEDLEIAQNISIFNDIRADAEIVFYNIVEGDYFEAVKERKHEENLKNEYRDGLSKLDEIIKSNNGHIAAGKLTWADFIFAGTFDYFKMLLRKPDLEKEYPSFQNVIDAVYGEPKVKAYTESRPKFEIDY